jgi:hypothetical protein
MPYLFAGLMVVGGLVYAAIKATDPSVRERICTVEEEEAPEPSGVVPAGQPA